MKAFLQENLVHPKLWSSSARDLPVSCLCVVLRSQAAEVCSCASWLQGVGSLTLSPLAGSVQGSRGACGVWADRFCWGLFPPTLKKGSCGAIRCPSPTLLPMPQECCDPGSPPEVTSQRQGTLSPLSLHCPGVAGREADCKGRLIRMDML